MAWEFSVIGADASICSSWLSKSIDSSGCVAIINNVRSKIQGENYGRVERKSQSSA